MRKWIFGFVTKSDLLMASAACAWGFSYIFMKWGLSACTPFQVIFLRFGIAFLLLLLIFRKKLKPNKTEIAYSIVLASAVFMLSAFYNYGLLITDASTAGFLAGTTVAFVPVWNGILNKKWPEKKVMVCVILTLGGVALMSLTSTLDFSYGALLCMAGAISYSIQIILTERALKRCRPLVIGIWQLAFASLFGFGAMILFHEISFELTPLGWLGILGLAVVSSAYGYMAQTYAPKSVTPERIGFLYSLEPIFCAILAFFFFGEMMSFREFIGAVMIIISILL